MEGTMFHPLAVTFNNGEEDVPLVIYITVTSNNGGEDVPLVIYITVSLWMWPTITGVQTKNPILTNVQLMESNALTRVY